MSPTDSCSHRLPRAGVDPIRDERTALDLLHAAAARPPRHETILVLLDGARRGVGLVVVSGTVDADAVLDVAERVLDPAVHLGRVAAAIVATVRPSDTDPVDTNPVDTDPVDTDPVDTDAGDADLDDVDRWLELDDIASQCRVELLEWFVLTDGVRRPRELVEATARW